MSKTKTEDIKIHIGNDIVIANPSIPEKINIENARTTKSSDVDTKQKKLPDISRQSWIENRLCQIIVFIIWAIINCYFFYSTYTHTCEDAKFYYMAKMLGKSLCVAKAAAYVININCCLIMYPMCRGILVWLRTFFSKHLKGYLRRLFDHAKGYHIYCAYSIVVCSITHTVAHLFNNYNYMQNYDYDHLELNLANPRSAVKYHVIFGTVPGATGVLLLLILLYMFATSLKKVRSTKFEMFWYTHHLYILFFALLIAHGFHGVLRYQTNVDKHTPGCDHRPIGPNGTYVDTCLEPAKFAAQVPTSWQWVIMPLIVFLLDKIIRIYRRQGLVEIKKIILHEGKVMEIQMRKPGFAAQPGQYIRIKCVDIAKLEWHPFTLTKCPSEVNDEFGVQIKVVGEWTEMLSSQLSAIAIDNKTRTRVGNSTFVELKAKTSTPREEEKRKKKARKLRLKVEGPFGGPCQDVTSYQTGICVGAGIGVTPFTAVLNSLRDRAVQGTNCLGKLQRIYFVWVCRNIEDFSWCLNILYDAYLQFEQINKGLLVYKLFVTRANKISDEDKFLVGHKQEWLKSILVYGRPKWQKELHEIAKEHDREKIGVFFCGPRVAGTDLNAACLKERHNGNVFIYHKETLG